MKGTIMSRSNRRRPSRMGIFWDFVLTILTGGLWLIWVLIRYLRSNSN